MNRWGMPGLIHNKYAELGKLLVYFQVRELWRFSNQLVKIELRHALLTLQLRQLLVPPFPGQTPFHARSTRRFLSTWGLRYHPLTGHLCQNLLFPLLLRLLQHLQSGVVRQEVTLHLLETLKSQLALGVLDLHGSRYDSVVILVYV